MGSWGDKSLVAVLVDLLMGVVVAVVVVEHLASHLNGCLARRPEGFSLTQ